MQERQIQLWTLSVRQRSTLNLCSEAVWEASQIDLDRPEGGPQVDLPLLRLDLSEP